MIASGTMFEPAPGMPVPIARRTPTYSIQAAPIHGQVSTTTTENDGDRPGADPPATADEEEGEQGQRQQLQADRDGEDDAGHGRPRAQVPGQQAERQRDEVEVAEADLREQRQVGQEGGRRPVAPLGAAGDGRGRDRRAAASDDEAREPAQVDGLAGQLGERHEGRRPDRRVGVDAGRAEGDAAARVGHRVVGQAGHEVVRGAEIGVEVVAELRVAGHGRQQGDRQRTRQDERDLTQAEALPVGSSRRLEQPPDIVSGRSLPAGRDQRGGQRRVGLDQGRGDAEVGKRRAASGPPSAIAA